MKVMTKALVAMVLTHLGVTMVHGWAHVSAQVDQGPLAMGFVLVVIVLGPLAGLAWMRVHPRAGALLIALTMTASLLFGLANHFVIDGIDRVDHVAVVHGWFESTAVLLVVTEASAALLGFACASVGRRLLLASAGSPR
jgi:hypothetical protein